MIEIIDNSVQFAATLACCGVSASLYLKRRGQAQFLLTCFYGCFSLGLLYWTLYLVIYESTPDTFYVSEIVGGEGQPLQGNVARAGFWRCHVHVLLYFRRRRAR